MINRGVNRSIEGCGEIKRLANEVMKGAERDSRAPFLINRGLGIDIRSLRNAFNMPERHSRASKMNNRGAGDLNRGVRRSNEGSNDQSRGQIEIIRMVRKINRRGRRSIEEGHASFGRRTHRGGRLRARLPTVAEWGLSAASASSSRRASSSRPSRAAAAAISRWDWR
jgi:hypothetical protein